MTQQEIQERNEQIALMLGMKIEGTYITNWKEFNSLLHSIEDTLKFHSDWNWLMEAVSFINKTHNQNNPHRDLAYTIKYLLNGGWWGENQIPRRVLSDTEQLFLAVSDFAKLYNNKEL
jgi:hypothetical protein